MFQPFELKETRNGKPSCWSSVLLAISRGHKTWTCSRWLWLQQPLNDQLHPSTLLSTACHSHTNVSIFRIKALLLGEINHGEHLILPCDELANKTRSECLGTSLSIKNCHVQTNQDLTLLFGARFNGLLNGDHCVYIAPFFTGFVPFIWGLFPVLRFECNSLPCVLLGG